MELITATEAVKYLKSEVGVSISLQRFGNLKKRGTFKIHRKDNSTKDWFNALEVVESYFENVVPTTTKLHDIRTNYLRKVTIPPAKQFYIQDFDVPHNLFKEFEYEIQSANSTNLMLRDFAIKILDMQSSINHSKVKAALKEKYYCDGVMLDVLDSMIEDTVESIIP